ncbi:hypothetical protein ABZW32_35930 [Streptomyces sp. NPDC004667]|uniref:hypothetical protein n=1 Tax=Streptomyces sp. NPDC004667 TaxID=3154285 RepID=UPI0033BDF326
MADERALRGLPVLERIAEPDDAHARVLPAELDVELDGQSLVKILCSRAEDEPMPPTG